jgi:hypothetical protein
MGSGSPVGLIEYHGADGVGTEMTLPSQTSVSIVA